MYSVRIRNHFLVAHSLKREVFGPAKNMHGATYIVDVTFSREKLDDNNIVIDIGFAHNVLEKVLDELNYQNLDEHPELKDELTTSEFLAAYIHTKIKSQLDTRFDGKIGVTLGESHQAWASYSE